MPATCRRKWSFNLFTHLAGAQRWSVEKVAGQKFPPATFPQSPSTSYSSHDSPRKSQNQSPGPVSWSGPYKLTVNPPQSMSQNTSTPYPFGMVMKASPRGVKETLLAIIEIALMALFESAGVKQFLDISCMSFLPSPLARSRPYSDIAAPYSCGIGVMCAANTHHFLLSHCSHPKNEVRTIQVISPNGTFFVGLLSPSPYDSTVLDRPFQAFLQLWWTKLFCCHRKVGS